jgi:hypothetical protein
VSKAGWELLPRLSDSQAELEWPELGPLASVNKPAAPDRLAAILAEAPADTGWATQLRQMREEDLAVAQDTWAT